MQPAIAESPRPTRKGLHIALWVVQVLVAAVFLMAGSMKLVIPAQKLAAMPLPIGFIRFIGVAEIAGALGLLLPSATRILPVLTPVAAGGLVVIMVGAVIFNLTHGMASMVAIPALVGLLAAFVAWGRGRAVTIRPRG